MSDEESNNLLMLIEAYINLDKSKGKDITYDSIKAYIDKGVNLSGLKIDQDDYNKLFTKIEYQFKITHTESEVIFDEYDNIDQWYDPGKIQNNFATKQIT